LYLLSDLASSKKSESDYRVQMILGVDPDDNWFIFDVPYGRWQTTEYLDIMFNNVRTHRLLEVHAEDGQILQTMDSVIQLKQKTDKCYFNVVPLKPSGRQKEYRIRALQPRFKAHKIWFKEDAEYLKELESELLGFTAEGAKTLHDDLMDTLAYALDVCKAPYKATTTKGLSMKVDYEINKRYIKPEPVMESWSNV
jgi:predicted phage terminase large subunit-like protein